MKELAEWRREVYLGKPVDKSKFIWCPMGKPMFQEVSIPNVIYICILYIYIYIIYIYIWLCKISRKASHVPRKAVFGNI